MKKHIRHSLCSTEGFSNFSNILYIYILLISSIAVFSLLSWYHDCTPSHITCHSPGLQLDSNSYYYICISYIYNNTRQERIHSSKTTGSVNIPATKFTRHIILKHWATFSYREKSDSCEKNKKQNKREMWTPESSVKEVKELSTLQHTNNADCKVIFSEGHVKLDKISLTFTEYIFSPMAIKVIFGCSRNSLSCHWVTSQLALCELRQHEDKTGSFWSLKKWIRPSYI